MTATISVESLVPGGIRLTDHWHIRTDDGTCSRCRQVPESDVPLLMWNDDGHNMLRYCEGCLDVADDPFNPQGSGPAPIVPRRVRDEGGEL